jgi:hypothetical protein
MTDGDDCEAVGEIVGRGNRSARGNPAAVPLCPPQIPHDLIRARNRATAVGRRRLTACAYGTAKNYLNKIVKVLSHPRRRHSSIRQQKYTASPFQKPITNSGWLHDFKAIL